MADKLRIAINTGGGDAPGLNAVLYSVTMAARRLGWEVHGIESGYAGLLDTKRIVELTPARVAGIAHEGPGAAGGAAQQLGGGRREERLHRMCLRATASMSSGPRRMCARVSRRLSCGL